jgi:predicted lysophospholipase L1 biosynthesis ABC-type transport system permease subunit
VSVFAIILIVLFAIVAVFAVGGAIATARRARARESNLSRVLGEANEALARARAEDRGWDRDTLDAAVRAAYAARTPGQSIDSILLIQVVDRPGTDDDLAVFRIVAGGRETDLTLGRREGEWVARD